MQKREKNSKKKLIIILIIIGIIILATIAVYFLMLNKNPEYSFTSPDFSAGAQSMDKVTEAGNANAFENTKLNPFSSES